MCPGHARKLPSRNVAALMSTVDVFVDRADVAFGGRGGRGARRGAGRGATRHMARAACVFVQEKRGAGAPRALSGQVDMRDAAGSPARQRAQLVGWMRQAIQGQIDTFRLQQRDREEVRCHLCGKNLKGRPNHVDHGTGDRSFRSIVQRFESAHTAGGGGAVDVPVARATFERDVRAKWQRFHRAHAVLSMACVKCNLGNK